MNKRILSLVLALVMVLGTFGTVFAAATTPTGNEKVDKLIEIGLVKGYGDGTYGLAQAITRAEVATMVVRALDLEAVANASANFPSQFADMNSANVLWARGFVNVAAGQGIVIGYPNGLFVPAGNITYAEGAKMLVEVLGGLTEAEQANAVWPTTYLAKAAQLGIFADVDGIVDYNAPALRENLFEMVFNTLMAGTDLLIASTVEGIVVENYRTETLAKDEVVVHVMKDQVAKSSADENNKYFEESDEFKVVVTPELAEKGVDVETLLGKVVKVSFDKDNKVVGIEELAGYSYVKGTIDDISAKEIEVNEKEYTVSKSESRDSADERLYQVYLNNDDVEYDELDEEKAEYANITVRNGKVLFIDAYAFDDVAPVAKDIDAKDRVAYYDDSQNGEVRTLTVDEDAYVVNFVDGEMQLGDYKDISANDVIHFFENAKEVLTVIVRPSEDNMVEGNFDRASAARATEDTSIKIRVEGTDYDADLKESKRDPVYSTLMSGQDFFTLTDDYKSELEPFEDTDVVVLRDMFDKVQLIASETEDGTFYAMVIQVLNNEFRLLKADNTKEYYTTNIRDTEFFITSDGTTEEVRKSEFNVGSLVKVTAKGEVLTEVTLLADTNDMIRELTKNVVKTDVEGTEYLSKTAVVFIEDGKDSKAMTVTDFLDDYVAPRLADDEDAAVSYSGYVAFGKEDTRTKTKNVDVVVVTEPTEEAGTYNKEVVKVDRVNFAGTDKVELRVKSSGLDGELTTYKVTSTDAKNLVNTNKVVKGSIIEISLTKTDEPEIKVIKELIDEATAKIEKTYEVTNKSGNVIFLDKVEYRLAIDADVFGEILKGKFIAIETTATNNVIIAADVRDKNDVVVDAPETTGVVTYITKTRMELDDKNVVVIDADTKLVNAAGTTIAIGTDAIDTKIVVGDQVIAEKNVITLVLTKAQIDAAKLVNTNIKNSALKVDTLAIPGDKAAVTALENAYKALTDAQKAFVEKAQVEKLTALVNKIAELEAPVNAEKEAVKAVVMAVAGNDKAALATALANAKFTQSKVVAANMDAYLAHASFTGLTLSSTAANVDTALDTVNAAEAEKAAVKAVVVAVAGNDKAALATALANAKFTQSKVVAANMDAYLAHASFTGLTLSSTVANVNTALDTVNQAEVDKVAAAIPATFTATGAVNTVLMPTVPAGYTIAVATTATPADYSATGAILQTGSSVVTYTITHTATTLTATTGNVTVTVTVTP